MNKELDAKIVSFLASRKEQIFADVDRMLRIDSVKGEPQKGAPLGLAVNEALDAMLAICAAHGLKTRNIDGMVGEAVYGDGKQSVGIVSHVDIVPTGTGWTKPPLALTREGGMLFGRGVTDDKGPGVAALWALLAALDAGVKINKRIVFIFGGDEESGMSDIARYLETEKAPDVAFTPDGGFPAIYYEKTIIRGLLAAKLPIGSALKEIGGGTRSNVVPNSAEAKLSVQPAGRLPEKVSAEEAGGYWLLRASGTAAHGSMPEKGDNAIVRLLGALLTLLPKGDPALPMLSGLHACCKAYDGSGLNVACADEDGGPLTFNLGVIHTENGTITADYNIRHPSSIDERENIHSRLPEAAARAGWEASVMEIDTGFRLPRDNPFLKTLMDIYNGVVGKDEAPEAIGGGTYARKLPCAAAYGMLFAGDPETAHMADERISEESFLKAARIYAHAIAELGK